MGIFFGAHSTQLTAKLFMHFNILSGVFEINSFIQYSVWRQVQNLFQKIPPHSAI
jgi:hypothetical protein